MSVSEKDFRKVMGRFTTGVAIITTQHHGKPVGVTINTLTSVSLDPPLVLFCLGNKRMVYPAFFENPHCAIHILSTAQQELCKSFAHSSSQHWEGINYELNQAGCPLIPHSLGILHCRRKDTYDGGDHTIFLNHVEDIHWEESPDEKAPLVYYQGKFC
ncbi:MAG: flavin reductase family protein [Alphaproteobacteria bacterium]|jgi:flavin reductase (DIM6/NTAB) family NADH-FMN oxidoreductase RutF|nr:flavin reductase family protein [Alphaproteobacteria bacterium]